MSSKVSHLLFAANRWECVDTIKGALSQGTCVILDRYFMSGSAYTIALEKGTYSPSYLDPDRELPLPDLTFCLLPQLPNPRNDYGLEVLEKSHHQEAVSSTYVSLVDVIPNSEIINSTQCKDVLHRLILVKVKNTLDENSMSDVQYFK